MSQSFDDLIFRSRILCTLAFFAAIFVLSNLKHAPSRKLPLTARKTVSSPLNHRHYHHHYH